MILAMTDDLKPDMPLALTPHGLIAVILEQVAAGKSLAAVLDSNAGYPGRSSWYRWISEDADLSARYVKAVQQGVARRHAKTTA